ncbi:MAG: alpha-1,2-fucosyltransferase [Bacteroidota bacterium]
MIFIRLKGGLGNQMFQYAFGLKMAQQHHTQLSIDLSSLLDRSRGDFVYRDYDLSIFEVVHQFTVSPALLRFLYKSKSSGVTKLVRQQINKGRQHIKEAHFHYQPSLIEGPDNTIYEGWFQSYRYLEGVEDRLREEFRFKMPTLPISQSLYEKMQASQSVCLNVRRTDFLKVDNLNTTNLDYFLRGARHMANLLDNPVFFIFSDDIDWCREHIRLDHPMHIVDHSHKGHKFGNYLQLMSNCKHYIIPNSSFAWWAIWLNSYIDKKVIAPKKWFNDSNIDTSDLVPSDWIRL